MPLFSPRLSPIHLLLAALTPLAAALLCLGVHAAARASAPPPTGPVYSVAALWARLRRDPAHWVGRTVRVRAIALPCAVWIGGMPGHCIDHRWALFDGGPRLAATLLVLPDDAASRAPAWLRRLPIAHFLIPSSPTLQWGVPADYTLQVRLMACPSFPLSSCSYYAASLL